MMLLLCQILLAAVDTAIAVQAWRLRKAYLDYGAPPFSRALCLAAAALALHTAAVLPLCLVYDDHSGFGRAAILWHYLLFGLLPIWMYTRIVLESTAAALAGMVFTMRSVRPFRNDYSKAHTRLIEGDIEGAIQVYRDYFTEAPDDPQPLFELARVLEGQTRPEAAADVYREIMKKFRTHRTHWAKAAYFLAELLEHPLADPQCAIYHYEEILRHAPKTTYAQFSETRLETARKPSLN